jgi:hypothetical protein
MQDIITNPWLATSPFFFIICAYFLLKYTRRLVVSKRVLLYFDSVWLIGAFFGIISFVVFTNNASLEFEKSEKENAILNINKEIKDAVEYGINRYTKLIVSERIKQNPTLFNDTTNKKSKKTKDEKLYDAMKNMMEEIAYTLKKSDTSCEDKAYNEIALHLLYQLKYENIYGDNLDLEAFSCYSIFFDHRKEEEFISLASIIENIDADLVEIKQKQERLLFLENQIQANKSIQDIIKYAPLLLSIILGLRLIKTFEEIYESRR